MTFVSKHHFLLLFLMGFLSHAQEFPKKITIDNGSTNGLSAKKSTLNAPFSINSKKNDIKLIDISDEKTNDIQFVDKNKFADNGKKIEKRLNKKDKEIKDEYKVNQYLGDFKSSGKKVNIFCRDHEFVDGDRVKVYVNDVVVQRNILLTEKLYGFDILLEKGFNKIDFEALNQGSSGPNTAEFQVYDDNGKLVTANRWNLTTGVKATLIIVKE